MISKTNMLFLETIPWLKLLTALYEQIFEIQTVFLNKIVKIANLLFTFDFQKGLVQALVNPSFWTFNNSDQRNKVASPFGQRNKYIA